MLWFEDFLDAGDDLFQTGEEQIAFQFFSGFLVPWADARQLLPTIDEEAGETWKDWYRRLHNDVFAGFLHWAESCNDIVGERMQDYMDARALEEIQDVEIKEP